MISTRNLFFLTFCALFSPNQAENEGSNYKMTLIAERKFGGEESPNFPRRISNSATRPTFPLNTINPIRVQILGEDIGYLLAKCSFGDFLVIDGKVPQAPLNVKGSATLEKQLESEMREQGITAANVELYFSYQMDHTHIHVYLGNFKNLDFNNRIYEGRNSEYIKFLNIHQIYKFSLEYRDQVWNALENMPQDTFENLAENSGEDFVYLLAKNRYGKLLFVDGEIPQATINSSSLATLEQQMATKMKEKSITADNVELLFTYETDHDRMHVYLGKLKNLDFKNTMYRGRSNQFINFMSIEEIYKFCYQYRDPVWNALENMPQDIYDKLA